MENNLDIPTKEAKVGFDASKYDGLLVKIAKISRVSIDSHWIDGTYKPEMIISVPGIEIETEPVDILTLADGTKKEIVVKHRFTLQEAKKEDGSIEIYISKSPKANLWKFMRKMGVENLNGLIDKKVRLTTEPSKDPNDDRVWLRIVV